MKHFFIKVWFLLLVLFATKCNCAQEKGGLSSKKKASDTETIEQNEDTKPTRHILLSQLQEKPVKEAFVADLKKGASQLNKEDFGDLFLAAIKATATPEVLQKIVQAILDTAGTSQLRPELVKDILDDTATSLPIKKLLQQFLLQTLLSYTNDTPAFSNLLNKVKDELTSANYATLLEKARNKEDLVGALLAAGKGKTPLEVIQAEHSKTADTNTQALLQQHLVNNGQLVKQLDDQVGDAVAFSNLLNKVKDELTPANYATLLEKARNNKGLVGALLAAGKGRITPEVILSEFSNTTDSDTKKLFQQYLVSRLIDQVNDPIAFKDLLNKIKGELEPANYATLLKEARSNNKDLVGTLLAAGKDKITPETIQAEVSKTTDTNTKKLLQQQLVDQLNDQVSDAAAFKNLLNKIKDELTPANYATLLEKARNNKDLVGALLAAGKDQITPEVILSEFSNTTDSDTKKLFQQYLVSRLIDQVNDPIAFEDLLNKIKGELEPANYATLLKEARSNNKDLVGTLLAAGKDKITPETIQAEVSKTTDTNTKKLLQQQLVDQLNDQVSDAAAFKNLLNKIKDELGLANYATLLEKARNNKDLVGALLAAGKDQITPEVILSELSKTADSDTEILFQKCLVQQLIDQVNSPVAFKDLLNKIKGELGLANYATLLEKARNNKDLVGALLAVGKDKITSEVIQSELSETTDSDTKKLLQERLVNQLSDRVSNAAAFKKLLNKIKDELGLANYATLLEKARNNKDLVGALLAAGKDITLEVVQSELSNTTDSDTKKMFQQSLVNHLGDQVNDPIAFTNLLNQVKDEFTRDNHITLLEKARDKKDLITALLAAGEGKLQTYDIEKEKYHTTDPSTKELLEQVVAMADLSNVGGYSFVTNLKKAKSLLTPNHYATLLEKATKNNAKVAVAALLMTGKGILTEQTIKGMLPNAIDNTVKNLLEVAVNPTRMTKDEKEKEFFTALRYGYDFELIKFWVTVGKVDVNAKRKDRMEDTAVHWAVDNQDTKLITWLLQQGADIDAPNNYGSTPVLAAIYQENIRLIGELLAQGADPSISNKDGETPLLKAVKLSSVQASAAKAYAIAKLLLEKGTKKPNINAKDSRGMTPLHEAVWWGDLGLVELLLDHGASVNEKKNNGDTPLGLLLKAPWSPNCSDIQDLLKSKGGTK